MNIQTNTRVTIRMASPDDAPSIAAIYAYYVNETAISFEFDAPDANAIAQRMEASHAWIVAEFDGSIAGYAYASPFNPRDSYKWSVEVSIYIDPSFHRSGVGHRLLTTLLDALKTAGYVNAFAGITLPNPGSEGLFTAFGFKPVASYSAVGFKLGNWQNVGWWQLQLQPPPENPSPPQKIVDV